MMIQTLLAAAALAVATPTQPPAAEDPAVTLEGLRTVYAQTCSARAYGAYDDLCENLGDQIHRYEVEEARKAARRPAKSEKAATAPAPAPPP